MPLLLLPYRGPLSVQQYIGLDLNFDVSDDIKTVEGYQLYAVQKWVVDRTRPVNTLVVHTGDPSHKVTVIALRPRDTSDWDQAISHLRSDGRPKETGQGVLMVTSLAHFRSDYTIVHIPHGNFLATKDQLYANINLLRMGCSGRSALTLEEPSETTKDRFISTYHLPPAPDGRVFTLTVIEFVKLLQASLYLFGLFPALNTSSPLPVLDGLLCDSTTSALARWQADIGERYTHTSESMERVADPSLVSALLSVVLSIRNKLAVVWYAQAVPKDPFLHPRLLNTALSAYVHSTGGQRAGNAYSGGSANGHSSTGVHNTASSSAAIPIMATSSTSSASANSHSHSYDAENINTNSNTNTSSSMKRFSHSPHLSLHTPSFLSHHGSHPHSRTHSLTTVPTLGALNTNMLGSLASLAGANRSTGLLSTTTLMSNSMSTSPGGSAMSATFSSPAPSISLSPRSPRTSGGHSTLNVSNTSAAQEAIFTSTGLVAGTGRPTTYLTPGLIHTISSAYEHKQHKQPYSSSFSVGESSGLHNNHPHYTHNDESKGSKGGSGGSGDPTGAGGIFEPITDLGEFVKRVLGGDQKGKGKRRVKDRVKDVVGVKDAVVGVGGKGKRRGKRESLSSVVQLGLGRAEDGEGDGDGDVRDGVGSGEDGNASRNRVPIPSPRRRGSYGNNSYVSQDRREYATEKYDKYDKDPSKLVSGSIAGSVRGLWGGKVAIVARLRERIVQREEDHAGWRGGGGVDAGLGGSVRDRVLSLDGHLEAQSTQRDSGRKPFGFGGLWSDGDTDDQSQSRLGLSGARMRRGGKNAVDGNGGEYGGVVDGRSTEEESDMPFGSVSSGGGGGGLWGRSGKVRGKIESWTGITKLDGKLARKKDQRSSVDIAAVNSTTASPSISPAKGPKEFRDSRDSNNKGTRSPRKFSIDSANTNPSISGSGTGDVSLASEVTRRLGGLGGGVGGGFSGGSLRSQPQSPVLVPVVIIGDRPYANEDDDLLSSGQVSPVGDDPRTPKPFVLQSIGERNFSLGANGRKKYSMNVNAGDPEYDEKVSAFVRKRPWGNSFPATARVSSWSDPISARNMTDEEGSGEEAGARGHGEGAAGGEDDEEEGVQQDVKDDGRSRRKVVRWEEQERKRPRSKDYSTTRKRSIEYGTKRRRSFHDLSSLDDVQVLSIQRMRIDVELCGQSLIMLRREEHLKNVIATLQVLTSRLSETNTLLRSDYQTHLQSLAEVESRTKVLSDIDLENAKADKITQATNTLWYESEQFRIPDLWHLANPSRQKVVELRDKAFGTGSRRVPAGKHGAHGRFNRLQWTVDGQKRLVDHMGRTESEVEEEDLVDRNRDFTHQQPSEEDEADVDVVEHPNIRPMWLLRFFTSWGARRGPLKPPEVNGAKSEVDDKAAGDVDEVVSADKKRLKSPSTSRSPRTSTGPDSTSSPSS